jgi:hypothetical protein
MKESRTEEEVVQVGCSHHLILTGRSLSVAILFGMTGTDRRKNRN